MKNIYDSHIFNREHTDFDEDVNVRLHRYVTFSLQLIIWKSCAFLFRMYALQRIRQAGAHLTTSESIILGLVRDSSHPKFKDIQKLIMEVAPDSALLSAAVESTTSV